MESLITGDAENVVVRRIVIDDEVVPALALIRRVFGAFEAQGYSEEGLAEFHSYIKPKNIRAMIRLDEFTFWGCYLNGALVGVVALKKPCHISLFFVDAPHQRRGFGRKLFETVLEHIRDRSADAAGTPPITVHASPIAVPVYERLGFVKTAGEQQENGIRYIPMARSVVM